MNSMNQTEATSRKRIPVAGPLITEDDVATVVDALRTNWYEKANDYIGRFERLAAETCGMRYAISTPHATSSLHLAFAALGLKTGDEVVAPDVTWIASVAPIYQTGAEAVLVDILDDTWCIDPAAVERAITPRTKAILGVNLYGSMCDWPALRSIADRHGLALVEDAAESLGSKLNGKPSGSFGDFSILSFHGSKTVTTGEGGMLLTNDEALYRRALFLRDHGRVSIPERYQVFYNSEIAFKYKLSALQAALGFSQMQRLEALIDQKRRVFDWYRERLSGVNGVRINVEPPSVYNCFWMPSVVLSPDFGMENAYLMAAMDKAGVDTRPFFTPLSTMPAFAAHEPALRHGAKTGAAIARHGINLPSSALTTRDDVGYVCDTLMRVLADRQI